MRGFTIALAALAVFTLVFGAPVAAGLIAYDGFNYAAGSLAGQNGGSGWNGAWSVYGGGAVTVQSPGLSFGDLQNGGNKIYLDTETANLAGIRALPSALSANGTTTYISYIAQWEEGTRYFGLQLIAGTSGTTETGYFGKNSGQANWRFSGPITLDSGGTGNK